MQIECASGDGTILTLQSHVKGKAFIVIKDGDDKLSIRLYRTDTVRLRDELTRIIDAGR